MPEPVPVRFVYWSRWYYDHGSTGLPVYTTETDGRRDYPDRYLDRGIPVTIRPATPAEHDRMVIEFDRVTDNMAYGPGRDHFVSSLGNFEDGTFTKAEVDAAVTGLKARARTEPRIHRE